MNNKFKRSLIAYYSYGGNTAVMANKIQDIVGGDLFEIKHKKKPSLLSLYINAGKKKFFNVNAKIELEPLIDISSYDTIFIGAPVYAWTIPDILASFLSSNDFKGKRVISFATYGGGAGKFFEDFKNTIKNAAVINGIAVKNVKAADFAKQINLWLENIAL
jgi:flavodoxin